MGRPSNKRIAEVNKKFKSLSRAQAESVAGQGNEHMKKKSKCKAAK